MSTPKSAKDFQHFIGLRIQFPDAALPSFFPADNIIASMILRKLIETEFALDGLDAEVAIFRPLNQAQGLVFVDDLERGLSIVRRALGNVGLNDDSCEIAYLDLADKTWRCPPYGVVAKLNDEFDPSHILEQARGWSVSVMEKIKSERERHQRRQSGEETAE